MAPNWARCATARMRKRGCGRFGRSAGRATRDGSAGSWARRFVGSGGEEHEVPRFLQPGGFLGVVIVSQRGAVVFGDVGVGRNGAGGRAAGNALGAHELSNRSVILVLGHRGTPTPELTLMRRLHRRWLTTG